jgi:hypothetical protein
MKVLSIESTPNPNTIKLVVDTSLPKGQSYNFFHGNTIEKTAPEVIQTLLDVKGVKNILYFTNFIAVTRESIRDKWEDILIRSQEIINGPGQPIITAFRAQSSTDILYGEVQVAIQYFREIPMQVKLISETTSKKIPLSEKFITAIKKASESSSNMLMERLWKDRGSRFGEVDKVGQIILDELDAVYTEEKLFNLVNQSFERSQPETPQPLESPLKKETSPVKQPDWRKRFSQLDDLGKEVDHYFDKIMAFTTDQNTSVRRLSIAFIGSSKSPKALTILIDALSDPSVAIRRTAGDCLSDTGSKKAIPAMIESLKDKSRLVRWRAARFLYEVGDDSALPALKSIENAPEFEVALQVQQAINRIENEKSHVDPMWKKISKKDAIK